MMDGGLFLVAALAVGMIVLSVIAGRHLDQMEKDEASQRDALLKEIRRHDNAE